MRGEYFFILCFYFYLYNYRKKKYISTVLPFTFVNQRFKTVLFARKKSARVYALYISTAVEKSAESVRVLMH